MVVNFVRRRKKSHRLRPVTKRRYVLLLDYVIDYVLLSCNIRPVARLECL